MRIVDQKIAPKRPRRKIINAARAVRYVAHYQRRRARAEAREDVGDGSGEEEQSLRKLQGNRCRARRANTVNTFVNFVVVVGGKEADGGVDVGVV